MSGKKSVSNHSRQELDALIAKIRAKVVTSPEKTAILLKDWIERKPLPAVKRPQTYKKTG